MRPAPFALILLAACAQPDEAAYPRLLPMSELTAPPAIPAHAADAAADPQAVGEALRARRTATQASAEAIGGPVTDAAALQSRASALQSRAAALGQTAFDTPGTQPAADQPAAQPASVSPQPVEGADPATAARIRALRERAGALQSQPVGADAPLPLCPPGTPDPAASACRPAD